MKSVILVVFVGVLGAAIFWYLTENAKQERAERYRQQQIEQAKQEEREAKQREEDERIRKERMAVVAKEDAVKLFLRYLEKEEDRLKDLIEEAKLKSDMVNVDQQSFSDEMVALDRASEGESAASKKRGEKRRDEVEYVKKLLSSPVLNRLAQTYTGEDLSAIRGEFQNSVVANIKKREFYASRRDENQKKYIETLGKVDEEVDEKNKRAIDETRKVRDKIKGSLQVLQDRVEKLRRQVKKLEDKKMPSPWEKRELASLRKDLENAELQLSNHQDVKGLSAVDSLQNEAALAEVRARRVHDTALDIRTRADDATLADYTYDVSVTEAAMRYKGRAVDRISSAMREYQIRLSARVSDAKEKLAFLKESSTNMDFLNAEEVEDMRKKIAKRLSINVVGEEVSQ